MGSNKLKAKDVPMAKMKSMLRRVFGVLVTLAIVFPLAATVAVADSYPHKPVRLIIPFAPGGSNDIVGRLIAAKLSERLDKQVVVDNRAGAGGILGTEMVAKAEPDGYTLLIISSAYAVSPAVYKLPFDPAKAFVPVAKLGSGPHTLVVHPNVPVNTVKELVALAKQKPGQLIWAGNGAGSGQHLVTEYFKLKAGIDFKIVQFKGGGPAMIDVLGGHSQVLFGTLIQVLPHIKSGKFRVLGTAGVKRSSILPHVPTIAEAGVPGFEATGWWGVLAPAGTPVPIIDRLNHELKVILTSDEVKKRFLDEGSDVDYMRPAEFEQFIVREITLWKQVVKEANVKLEK